MLSCQCPCAQNSDIWSFGASNCIAVQVLGKRMVIEYFDSTGQFATVNNSCETQTILFPHVVDKHVPGL